jgi:hypothetical protein
MDAKMKESIELEALKDIIHHPSFHDQDSNRIVAPFTARPT